MRQRNKVQAVSRALAAAIVAGVGIGLSACDEYLDRRDTVSRVAGEANAFNKATQTIERWPRHARRDRWASDGERARLAVERYRNGTVIPPPPVGSSATSQAEGVAKAAK